MKYKEVYDIAMPIEKRNEERYNIWASVIRPLTILLTIPFIKRKVKPLTITAWSILSCLIGGFLVAFGKSLYVRLFGWFFIFIWSVLDNIDGNLARCTKQCSDIGDLWDTTGGYAAMVLIYYSAGTASFFSKNTVYLADNYWFLLLGGLTAIFSIFPRLVLQKKKTYGVKSGAVDSLSDKHRFGLMQILAMNLVSPSGLMQIIFLICIGFRLLNIFVVFYFVINLGIMSISLKKLLRE